MLEQQLRAHGILERRVVDAMLAVPRERFVPPEQAGAAYVDGPLPIGEGQTISQPYVVAYMTELLRVAPDHRVLEIGTGSGYQAAVLAHLSREVYSVETIPELARRAHRLLGDLGYLAMGEGGAAMENGPGNVRLREGDGYDGWPEYAPFDRIMMTAAAPDVPAPLIEQLHPGGLLVAPIGPPDTQWIVVRRRTASGIEEERTIPVRFVPFVRRTSA